MFGLLLDIYDASVRNLPHLKFNKDNEHNRTLVSLYATIIEMTNSAIILRKSGVFTGVDVILRTTLEAHVDLINLANDATYMNSMRAVYHKEWIRVTEEGLKGENQFLAFFKNNVDAEEQLAHHKSELAKCLATSKMLTNFEKFKMAGMEEIYRSIYNSLCNESHNNIRALNDRHFRQKAEGAEIVIFDQPTKIDLAATLDCFIATLLLSCEILHHYFKSDEKIQNEFKSFRAYKDEKGHEWTGDLGL
ncbi:DUF5677 domain-containing protein [Brucella thiophenivorans]|uniref:Uncharacterized protein n=1 Tax=Brucella thiophenivorans TaxID=571255 RepID=A0A256FTU5_9HYPH|nr:DUF5677 domain-containing protein [Brucella thiophenivorans]OYR18269.1 hypothetical protein CEV31_4281 [Brucella thiophenivorans]